MDPLNKKDWRHWLTIAYKILHDTLFLLLLVFCAALIAEGIIPGFLSSHLSFTKIIIAIFANISAIALISKKIELPKFNYSDKKSKLIAGLFFFSIILIVNSLLKFGWLENAIITLISGAIFFYFYRIFSFSENS
jgi:hypothetical protein